VIQSMAEPEPRPAPTGIHSQSTVQTVHPGNPIQCDMKPHTQR